MISSLLNMIMHEVALAGNVVKNGAWDEIAALIERALVMVKSGVGPEANVHMSKAISRTTTIGHQSMSSLKEKGLI